jgi:hypothetical protein
MLPLRPPTAAPATGYPTRDDLLADPALRRRVVAALAAPTLVLALGACAGSAEPQAVDGAVPAPRAEPRQLEGKVVAPAPPATAAVAEPNRLKGEAVAPRPPATQAAVPRPLGGAPPPPRPPRPLLGDVAAPAVPPTVPASAAVPR